MKRKIKIIIVVILVVILFIFIYSYKKIDIELNKYIKDNKSSLEYQDNKIFIKDLIDKGYIKNNKYMFKKINPITSYYVVGRWGKKVIDKHFYYEDKKYKEINTNLYKYLKNDKNVSKIKKDYYFIGDSSNNYIWYNSMLYKVIKFNKNEITLISDIPLTSISSGNEEFDKSYINDWLNEYKEKINEKNVSLLDVDDYNNVIKNKKSFLNVYNNYYLVKDNKLQIYIKKTNKVYPIDNNSYAVIPVIKIKMKNILYGKGTYDDPYIINKFNEKKELLNNKNIGSYVIYSNYLWRIIDVDDEENTKLKMASTRERKTFYAYKTSDKKKSCYGFTSPDSAMKSERVNNGCTNKFDKEMNNPPLYKKKNIYHAGGNNIAYYLNSEEDKDSFYNSLENKKLIEKHKWNVTEYNIGDNYKKDKEEYITEKIGMISVGEMFSGNDDNFYYYTLTPSKDNKINYINFDGQIKSSYSSLPIGVRPVLYLKSTVKTISGNGTLDKPYKIK